MNSRVSVHASRKELIVAVRDYDNEQGKWQTVKVVIGAGFEFCIFGDADLARRFRAAVLAGIPVSGAYVQAEGQETADSILGSAGR